ncbi:MAG: DsbA family oxidoreductase [Solobacterium sp.]|nr:DsbA family oxidoreductase [Solobacterium sp.]
MKIIYWSDYACPFCYIGESRLKRVAAEMGIEDLELEMKAYELHPEAGKHAELDNADSMAKSFGTDRDTALEKMSGLIRMGREEGLDFNYATARNTNTRDAHRITKLAQSKSPETADRLIELLYKAYFSKNLELADHSVLRSAAMDAGLNMDEVNEVLSTDKYLQEVIMDEQEARYYGIRGVPFFIIGKYGVSGAQPEEYFHTVFEQVQKETLEEMQGAVCGPDGCAE